MRERAALFPSDSSSVDVQQQRVSTRSECPRKWNGLGTWIMKTLTTDRLFTPTQVGPIELKHRVVMGPLTRSRSVQPGNIPGDLMLEYYSQRASDGGLIVSEATSISVAGGGWFAAPGLYSEEQVAGWKRITDAVHQKRGYM